MRSLHQGGRACLRLERHSRPATPGRRWLEDAGTAVGRLRPDTHALIARVRSWASIDAGPILSLSVRSPHDDTALEPGDGSRDRVSGPDPSAAGGPKNQREGEGVDTLVGGGELVVRGQGRLWIGTGEVDRARLDRSLASWLASGPVVS